MARPPVLRQLTKESSVKTLPKLEYKFAVFNQSIGRDRLWVRADEARDLAAGSFPTSLKSRLVRFHLVDNTRCYPLFWEEEDVRSSNITIKDGVLQGSVQLETVSGDRGYEAELYGLVESKDGQLTRFDLVAKGNHWGGKSKGSHRPPTGKFQVAIAFTLSDRADPFDDLPPAAIRTGGYLEPK